MPHEPRPPQDADRHGAPAGSPVLGTGDITPSQRSQHHTVQAGETLRHIAQAEYGDAERWEVILEANRDQIADPDLLRPGQILVIPSRDDAT